MTFWADQKLRARRVVQETFALPAVFHAQDVEPELPLHLVDVRPHDKSKMVGDLAGTNLSYAEFAERPTEMAFWVEQLVEKGLDLRYGVRIVLRDHGGFLTGWHVDNVLPRDGAVQSAQVSMIPEDDLEGLTAPDGTVIGS